MSYVISAIYSTLLTHLSNDYRYSIVQFSLQDNHTFLVSHHFLLFPDFLDVIHFLKCLVYLKLLDTLARVIALFRLFVIIETSITAISILLQTVSVTKRNISLTYK